jgi:hypothetical protein
VQQLEFGLGDLKAELQDFDLTSQPLDGLTDFGIVGRPLSALSLFPKLTLHALHASHRFLVRFFPGFLPPAFRSRAGIIGILPVGGEHGKTRRDESAQDP